MRVRLPSPKHPIPTHPVSGTDAEKRGRPKGSGSGKAWPGYLDQTSTVATSRFC